MDISVFYTLLPLMLCAVDVCVAATPTPEPVKDVEYYTNKCLDGIYHKDKPGPENDLYGQVRSGAYWQNHNKDVKSSSSTKS